jgi:K+-transporting ATPase ATPase A chain
MSIHAWLQAAAFVAAVVLVTKPLGAYMHRVFEATPPFRSTLGRLERLLYRLSGVDPDAEQGWLAYAGSLLAFSAVSMLGTYAILRLQHLLPWNPQALPPVAADLAFNTAASFTTNTNWQSYAGESTMSYLSQMAGLAWHNFISAAAGMGVALAVARGLTRRRGPEAPRTLGNFWADLVRATVYLLLPVSVLGGLFLVSQGALQTLAPYRELVTLEGVRQVLALGPVGSQEVIKQFGTNGGGFFNANSAHPFENPTPLANFLQMFLIFAIPAGLTWTYGRMARNQRQGWALFGAMLALFLAGYAVVSWAEHRPNPALAGLGVDQSAGNLEGKEVRFGVDGTALFATVTTDASCGAVNGMHDSFNPLGGLVPLVNIQLGEIVFGGVGAGLYGMLVFVVLTVFIAGLMVGRTPELLGKKIEPREMKLATIYILIFPLVVLPFTAWASVTAAAGAAPNAGPHGLTELLYGFSSAVGNNGSAFAGLDATKPFWTVGLGVAMLLGRFLMCLPVLAIAGSMVGKKSVEPGPGTFPTDGWLFGALLVAVIVIVGALTFFPALTLGPIVEHYLAAAGKVF